MVLGMHALNGGNKKASTAMTMITVVVVMAAMGIERTNGQTTALSSSTGASYMCVEACMPMCMKLDGAVTAACHAGCTLGCDQLKGKGRNLAVASSTSPDDPL
ncbi:OLC1v1007728C1 [Oldenlandia corymbosa var. corymbosa]|uniref:OLC1v1007728C1 n=1 Tax=Oldenlandia corymbosa var. corymbosa TaxID=529605 RepID=A0AAV1DJX0_OLDCO|nr:OLC1v1007728C1 [Oldenlandia corymbosa var. corymbosa]